MLLAGLSKSIMHPQKLTVTEKQAKLMSELSELSFEKYNALKHHKSFIPYLEEMSTLRYYGKANIGSRPGKRGNKDQLTLNDLRAISFVGSWSQLKQNVPGYFGLGTAIQKIKLRDGLDELKTLFTTNELFKALILNSMMSLTKTYFSLTKYMDRNERFKEFWNILNDEFELSKAMLLEISGYEELMQEEKLSKRSIELREKIVLPLICIQQYALQKIGESVDNLDVYEKIVIRSLYGNINASRNSA
jgi:phosphoenolpyruvate carboxylase